MSDAVWQRLSTLPPLRDEVGTIVLEDADDDARTATFRVHARMALTATVTPAGAVRFDGDAPAALVAALAESPAGNPQPPSGGSDPPEGSPASPRPAAEPKTTSGRSDPPGVRRWVAAGVAAAGIAALAARRRR